MAGGLAAQGLAAPGTAVVRRWAAAVAVAALVASVCVAVQLAALRGALLRGHRLPAAAGSWPFSEGSGTTTADSSGNGHSGTLGTGATWAAPRGGRALDRAQRHDRG